MKTEPQAPINVERTTRRDRCQARAHPTMMRRIATSVQRLFSAALLLIVVQVSLAGERHQVLILQNVMLPDPSADASARKVSIRFDNGSVNLVTADAIPAEGRAQVYDARRGFVVGDLVLGQPATLVIVDGDPRQKPQLLLDTRWHATFVVTDGQVLRNHLLRADQTASATRMRNSSGWLAYTPPPMALPLDAQGARWNQFDSKYVSGVFIGALGLDRTNWLSQSDDSQAQVGDLSDFGGGEIRALRFGFVGRIKFERPWIWTLFFATNAFDKGINVEDIEDFNVYDARLDIPLSDKLTLSAGKQKEPISMERLMSLQYLPLQERAAVLDALLTARKIGVALSSPLFNERVTLAGGVFNSCLERSGGINDNPTSLTGRVTGVPFETDDRNTTVHLGAAYRYSTVRGGAVIGETPEFAQAPDYVETPFLEGDSLAELHGEASYRRGPLFLYGEYLNSGVRGTPYGDLNFSGYHLTGSWAITGEVRPYLRRSGVFGRLPVARGVRLGGWGALELAARFSNLDLSDGGLDGGEMDIWSLGFNWFLTADASIGINYRYIELDRFGVVGESHGLNTRLMLQID